MNKLSKFLVRSYGAATVSAAAKLTSKLRRDAFSAGWPSGVSRRLQVQYSEGQYVVRYPKAITSRVMDLEYGNQENPPSPVIRTFVRGIKDTGIRQEVEKSFKKARFY